MEVGRGNQGQQGSVCVAGEPHVFGRSNSEQCQVSTHKCSPGTSQLLRTRSGPAAAAAEGQVLSAPSSSHAQPEPPASQVTVRSLTSVRCPDYLRSGIVPAARLLPVRPPL